MYVYSTMYYNIMYQYTIINIKVIIYINLVLNKYLSTNNNCKLTIVVGIENNDCSNIYYIVLH